MTLLAPLGLLAGLLAIPVLLTHVLRPKRTPHEVSSLFLWRSLERPVAAVQPWQRLRWSLLLLLQLLIVALLALALARPAFTSTTQLADHSVFIVDTSASMQATDVGADRLDAAKERAVELWNELPRGGAASIVVASATSEVVLTEASDERSFLRALAGIRPTAGSVDFDRAFTLAESLASPGRPTGYVLLSDGGLDVSQQRLAPAGTRYEAIGADSANRAVSTLAVTRSTDGGLDALVAVSNTGGPATTQTLRVDVDGVTVERQELELDPDSTTELVVAIPPGSHVEAFLEGEDLLPIDNRRVVLSPAVTDLAVRLESSRNPFFLEEVLSALGVEIVTDPLVEPDLVIYDGVDVPLAPQVPFIAVASSAPPPGLTVIGDADRPVPTLILDDPLLADVDLSTVSIATSQRIVAEAGRTLVASEETPLLVSGRTGDTNWFYLSFELEKSNMPLTVSFPLLMSRLVTSLTLSDGVPPALAVGSRPDPLPFEASVTSPLGVTQVVDAGGLMPVLDRVGFWTIEGDDGTTFEVAANIPRSEMDLQPATALDGLRPAAEQAAASTTATSSSLVPWLLLAVLAVMIVELFVSWRSIGVSRWQWRFGLALRAGLAVLLVLALIDPPFSRAGDGVRVALVVDVSASLGPEGREAVDDFVARVRADGDIDTLAVIEVGEVALVSQPFGADKPLIESPDPSGTDLRRSLRLAASVLDGSSRERIIVVSDGRATTGAVNDEIERLAALGTVVETHVIDIGTQSDVAVTGVESPGTVSEGEEFELVATVSATDATTVGVDVLLDGTVVAGRTVDVEPGLTEVAFALESGVPGVGRYEVVIRGASDAIPENDRVFAAVSVSGPPRVFVAAANEVDAAAFAEPLRARAIDVDHGAVSSLPTLQGLGGYTTVVLVNVAARELGAEQVTALDSFVRDQGRGLVVIGGEDSFALGGYADTALEELLPVRSDIQDPKRLATVAEVLLIDTSESMGACHCAPVEGQGDDPFAGEAIEGGVNKTDISRSAAARAIEALSANDEVGVLAFNGRQEWVIPLQALPSEEVVTSGLQGLKPRGETRIGPALKEAAAELRDSTKELKHIILFSDGFTPELFDEGFGGGFDPALTNLVEDAEALADEGITISVVATGEGAAPLLEAVAEAGNGRFYPGRDLSEIPEIFVQEARLASRDFINEGEFFPTVTSTAAPVRNLSSSPAVLGYVATTPKDTADVMLQVGALADPLLASWRIGLGRVTVWTSDLGERWAAPWAAWDAGPDFWSSVVRDTFPLEGVSGRRLQATIEGESLLITLESEEPWPAGAEPTARVSAPDGSPVEVPLTRDTDTTFIGAVPAPVAGTYAVGVTVAGTGDDAVSTAIATRSYPVEFLPTTPVIDLARLSQSTGGRGHIEADQAFDRDGLDAGTADVSLRWWFLLAAALLWPIDVAMRRVRLSRSLLSRQQPVPPPPPSPARLPTPS